jgi:hypothetical protein
MNFVANDPDVLSTEECAVFPCLTKFAGGPEHDFAAPAYASRPEMAATMAGRADRKVPGRVGCRRSVTASSGSRPREPMPLRRWPIAANLMRLIGGM